MAPPSIGYPFLITSIRIDIDRERLTSNMSNEGITQKWKKEIKQKESILPQKKGSRPLDIIKTSSRL